mgnify:CR=1 FL=1
MKALKSKLVKQLQKAQVRIPVKEGAKFAFEGKEYVLRKVPKAQ